MAGMNNILLLDTNAIIYFLGGNPAIVPLLDQKIHHTSVMSEIEVLGFDFKSTADLYAVKRYLRSVKIIMLTNEIKEIAIRIKKDYKAKVGDAIICATALYYDLPFISADKNFTKIRELQLILFSH
ncbi:MAG: type II toxin-antitoxin system VapC family toxin [Bacteroidota bacterium]|nr:type II toxin-antitoxin system VapC family toxin [Bacteroidota bacterium]